MTEPAKRHVSRRDILILAGILLVGVVGAMYIMAGSGEEQGLYARMFFMSEQVLPVSLATDSSFTLAEVMNLDPQGLNAYRHSDGAVNIAMWPVLRQRHYRFCWTDTTGIQTGLPSNNEREISR